MKLLFYILFIGLSINISLAKNENFEYESENWDINLDYKNKSPYGAFMFFKTSLDYCSEEFIHIKKPLRFFLSEKGYYNNPETYIFIGNQFSASKLDWIALKEFVEEGNNAFISCGYLPFDIQEEFFNYDWSQKYGTEIEITYSKEILTDTTYNVEYLQNFEKVNYTWRYIEESTIKAPYQNLHKTDGGSVLIKVKYGKGYFYFHSEPLLLTNINLIKESGYEYAKAVLSNLDHQNIYYDSYTPLPFTPPINNPFNSEKPKININPSPLSFIFGNKSLRWTYILLLITILIYVIFKSKRKQRLIALIQEDNNTSLQFVNTMSMLYLKQNNHHAIIKQKKKIFLHFLRSRYFLTIKDIDKQFIEHLSKVSQIENDRIELIFKYFNAATSNREFSNGDLADLHNNIEFFYKNCA